MFRILFRNILKILWIEKKIKNPFQEDEPDAPDNTVSLKIVKGNKMIGGKMKKITKKIFALDNGAQHIIEIED